MFSEGAIEGVFRGSNRGCFQGAIEGVFRGGNRGCFQGAIYCPL